MYEEQFRRWQAQGPTAEQRQQVERLAQEVQATRPVVEQVLVLAELRKGSLDRILELSDAEVGLMTLLGLRSEEFRKKRG
ncbi:hypothetical protein [Deinococcus aluminii]|uniref:Uncharacterized protein n=1 Tax=Deinococcus aluminii TaxID=1656885 RepID=A0ABP9XHT5_9DEIO